MNIYPAYIIIFLAILLGWGSLIAFIVFLFLGSLSVVNLGLNDNAAIWFDAGLSLFFFMQHSIMVRKSFRRRMAGFITAEYYGAFYATASGIALMIMVIFWQKTVSPLIVVTGLFRLMFRLLFIISIAGFVWGAQSLKYFDPLGIRNILNHLRGRKPKQARFIVKGAYQWVRHPLYFFMLLMIWASPDLTADRLLFNVLWTLWIVIGAMFEERDLVNIFGNEYREYREKVPMLIPIRLPVDNKKKSC